MRAGRTPLVFFAAATTLLLLNYPWLSLFSTPQLLFGLPPLVLYLFGIWLGFILIVRLLVEPSRRGDENENENENEDKPDA